MWFLIWSSQVRYPVFVILIVMVAALILGLKLTDPILRHVDYKRPKKRRWIGPSFSWPSTRRSRAGAEPASDAKAEAEAEAEAGLDGDDVRDEGVASAVSDDGTMPPS